MQSIADTMTLGRGVRVPWHENPQPEQDPPQFVVRFPTFDSWHAYVIANPNAPHIRYCRYGCGGVGFMKKDARYLGNGTNIVKCPCASERQPEREQNPDAWAQTLSPREQGFTLDNWLGNDKRALAIAQRALAQRWGMFTFWGSYGVGKTGLLAGVVNEARNKGLAALYKVTPVMLDELRAAYESKTFDRVFDELCSIGILALDEIDKYKATEWAREKMFLLIDRRYSFADQLLTLFATNARPNPAEDAIWSRLTDAARGEVVEIKGRDLRPYA